MNGSKINESILILSKFLLPYPDLSTAERKSILNFLVEEKIKTIKVYESKLFEDSESILDAIRTKKTELLKDKQLDQLARIRDIENEFLVTILLADKYKKNNATASFHYTNSGLALVITRGYHHHTVEELEKLGLQPIFFLKSIDVIKIQS